MSDVVTKTLTIQRTVFDFTNFASVLVAKEVQFTPFASMEEALTAVGNDTAKLIRLINEGREKELRDTEYASNENWRTFDDEDKLNGPYTGTFASTDAVNEMVRTMSKTLFGYDTNLPKAQKDAIKQQAREFIKNNQAIRQQLTVAAGIVPVESTSESETTESETTE